MPGKVHSYSFTVLEHHLDTFSHVNNATYLSLFEEARWDWITRNGYGLERIRETGLGPVVLAINIVFKRELRLRQSITIDTIVLDHSKKISVIKQEMRDAAGNLCCEATFSFALFDLKSRRIVNPTEEWKRAFSSLES